MYCKKCKRHYDDTSAYCKECGEMLIDFGSTLSYEEKEKIREHNKEYIRKRNRIAGVIIFISIVLLVIAVLTVSVPIFIASGILGFIGGVLVMIYNL